MYLLFVLFLSNITNAQVIEKVVAVVNDEIITQSSINKFKDQLKKGKFVDDLVEIDKPLLLKDQDALVQQLINEKIIDSAVKQLGLSVTVEKVEQEIDSIARRNKVSRTELKNELKQEGISFSEYQSFIKQRLERQALIERAVTSKIKITDEEVQAYYFTKNKNNSAESFEYSLAHILISTEKSSDAVALEKASDILKKVRSGESFDKLASQYSEDPNFTTGGYLGSFKSGEFLKELEAGVRGLDAGAVSSPIKTKVGYHLVKVLNKKIISDPKFEGQKEEIRNILYKEAFQNQFKFWLEQQRAEAFIKINK